MSTYMAANLALIQPTGFPIADYAQVYENMRGVPGEFPDMPAWEDTPVPQLALQRTVAVRDRDSDVSSHLSVT